MTVAVKFPECKSCVFFNRSRAQPVCGLCGCGEFYEEKISTRHPTQDELMAELERVERQSDD